jgi:acyl carrier protein
MTSSSRTPEKAPNRCPACGASVSAGTSARYGEVPCPQCGKWLWFANRRDGTWFHEAERAALVRRRVYEIVAENLGVNMSTLNDSVSFMPDIGADTLDIVEMVMAVEAEFQITIPDAEAEFLMRVGDLVDYVMRQRR